MDDVGLTTRVRDETRFQWRTASSMLDERAYSRKQEHCYYFNNGYLVYTTGLLLSHGSSGSGTPQEMDDPGQ